MFNEDKILESVIDPTRRSLDPLVFNKEGELYVLRPEIREQILGIIEEISTDTGLPLGNVYLKGSILSFQWMAETDVDVLLELDPQVGEADYEKIKELLKDRTAELVIGTEHPLQFYVIRGSYEQSRADGLYDVKEGKWIFGPYDLEIDVEDYLQGFEETVHSIDLTKAELQRDLIDYEVFNQLKDEDVANLEGRLQTKIEEINDSVEALVAQYQHLSDMRDYSFEKPLSPQEIREYGSKNALPENVVFKLLERYHYINFMKELKRFMKKRSEVGEKDVEKVAEIVGSDA